MSPCPGQETIWSFWNWLISFIVVFTQPPLSDPSLPSNSWPLANLVLALAKPEDFSSRTYLGKISTRSPALQSPALRFPSPERIFSRSTLNGAQGGERRAECRRPRRDHGDLRNRGPDGRHHRQPLASRCPAGWQQLPNLSLTLYKLLLPAPGRPFPAPAAPGPAPVPRGGRTRREVMKVGVGGFGGCNCPSCLSPMWNLYPQFQTVGGYWPQGNGGGCSKHLFCAYCRPAGRTMQGAWSSELLSFGAFVCVPGSFCTRAGLARELQSLGMVGTPLSCRWRETSHCVPQDWGQAPSCLDQGS